MAFGVFQFRRGTAAQWTAANTVLASGELGLETDTAKFKIGNGTTAWNSLPYGGIKGDTGATGAAGVSPTVAVGATTVVNPATAPSVTDADAGPNADLRFSLPRAATLSVGPTTTITPVNNPSVSRATNAAGDVTDTFSLPRARNVTAGTTTTGAAGTSASVTSQADANGDVSLNFTIPRGDTGAQGPQGPAGQSVAVADEGTTLTSAATSINFTGGGVTATTSGSAVTVNVPTPPTPPTPANAPPPAIASASSTGTTTTEFALEDHTHAGVTSVNTRQGAVTLTKTDVGLANVANPVAVNVHTTAAQTLNQTLTAAATMTIPANSLVAGDAFEIDVLFGSLVNTTAASNLEVAVFINGAQNAIALAAMGTTAVAAPGRGGRALFKVVFRSVGAAGTALANGTIHVNNLANFASNQVAVQTVNTTAAVTLDVRVRTSAATTTGTVQFAAIDQAT